MAQAKEKKKSSFVGDVIKLVSGTTVAQIIGILAAPVLSRLYLPEAFGVTALFISITGVLIVISCLRYELTIMLPKTEKEAANLLALSIFFVLLITTLSMITVYVAKPQIVSLLNLPEIGPFLWLIPLAVFLNGSFQALNYWNTRTKHFGRLSIAKGLSSLTNTGSQLGAGFSGFATNGAMIAANVAGYGVSTLFLGARVLKDHGKLFLKEVRWKQMVAGMKRYKDFPLYGTWASLLNSISWQLPAFFLAYYFSSTIVGFYALGNRVLRLPMNMIGGAIGQVFFQRASEAHIEGNLDRVVEQVFERLVKLGLFPLLILTLVGDKLFVVVFGSEWLEAGVYTQILSVWTFFWFISSPLSKLFSVLERQDLSLKINIVVFVTRVGSLLAGGMMGSARWALIFFAVSGVLVYGYLSFVVMLKAGVSWASIFKIIFKNILYFLPAVLILFVLRYISVSNWIILIISFLLSIMYFLYVLFTDKEIRFYLKKVKTFNKIITFFD